ncbi:MAG: 16S rRNA (cytidine(1402)-2'-O)-methyltransferase [Caldimicrobium sp.]|nr:16S rRNA (cytidine(1402)-2'-O)-methyltransferase [Caldimicrobium sp.]MCX7612985.1 16S rRNA (cytidine(1402)-2'-O)-methyltransferase [Caldimicrobium sp.]MDW8183224.1 16S rRNA (cytidine(1402)-2'-O)-methyltransferase [Caldimicrobium sp.]
MTGILYVVSLPIGNLKDITLRALAVLKEVDLILTEDTRSFQKIAKAYEIPPKKLISFYREKEIKKEDRIIEILKEGKKIALCSEAGTPLISDPGSRLIQRAYREGIKVVPIPGASALSCALSVSGIDLSEGFVFLGFPPKKEKLLRERLSKIPPDLPLILFISPHDFPEIIALLLKILGNREVFLARELTKFHEELLLTTLDELSKREAVRGEITIVVGRPYGEEFQVKEKPSVEHLQRRYLELKARGLRKREIAKILAVELGITAKDIYEVIRNL